ncbi:MAG TPA: hypothetical protein VKV69_12985 [Actinomycetota bacterium]|nr:hypothetical protein [Actinomycetota bacterium]
MKRAVTGMLAITLLAGFGALAHDPIVPVGARVRATGAAAVADRFTLSSSQIEETGLMFVGLADVTIGSTTTSTMKFTIDGATMHGMDMTTDCQTSFTVLSKVTDPDTATVGASTLYLTSFSFLLSGSPQSFTVAAPPFVGYSLPSDTLTSVEMVGVRADVATMTLHNFSQQLVAC